MHSRASSIFTEAAIFILKILPILPIILSDIPQSVSA